MDKKKCIYYVDYGCCSCNNDMDYLGECIYKDGIIDKNVPLQCVWAE